MSREELIQPLESIHGIGPVKARILEKLDLCTPADMLFFFPRDYENYENYKQIPDLVPDELQTITATVTGVQTSRMRRGSMINATVQDKTGAQCQLLFFNQPFRLETLTYGTPLIISGKPTLKKNRWHFTHPVIRVMPEVEHVPDTVHSHPDTAADFTAVPDPSEISDPACADTSHQIQSMGIQPVYPLTEGIAQWEIRRILRGVITRYAGSVEEAIPEWFRHQNQLPDIESAIHNIHFPETWELRDAARRRFVFQELFLLQLALGIRRRQLQVDYKAPILEATSRIDQRIRHLFPYDLTSGQIKAISDITRDTVSGHPMNRLLQGDVGCGKTSVAVYAMMLAVAHGYQAVIMAPTEVLARQHQRTLTRMLEHSEIHPELLVGGLPVREREKLLQRISSGNARLVVGTQALLQDDVSFGNLGMLVIDEQHKFGVRQRARLRASGESPHYLVMTATPIPRTVTMTLFGDLDVTSIRDLPPGRQKIHTYLANESRKTSWWEFFREQIDQGRQGYVVVPFIEDAQGRNLDTEAEDYLARSAVANIRETYVELSSGPLRGYHLGLIHGRMKPEEKEQAMLNFRSGETQILVATSVIEVGVDIPNATLMTILGAERFGIAQLHQLRGRITRGKHPGFCCVFPSREDENVQARLKAFTSTSDGFQLAELDFNLRGPGDLFGTQQHGMPPLRIANLQRDQDILEETRHAADELLTQDPGLSNQDFNRLRSLMLRRYGKVLALGDVG